MIDVSVNRGKDWNENDKSYRSKVKGNFPIDEFYERRKRNVVFLMILRKFALGLLDYIYGGN